MVIWPEKISPDDTGWQQACALMQVLAIDPRRTPSRATRHLGRYYELADDILERPNIWVDKRLMPAPYFSYCLRFNVSASVIGTIPVDDEQQITEFRRAVNAALRSELSTAERKLWEANEQRIVARRETDLRRRQSTDNVHESDAVAAELDAVAANESAKASCYYAAIREQLEAKRRSDRNPQASPCNHAEIMAELIRYGTTLRQAA